MEAMGGGDTGFLSSDRIKQYNVAKNNPNYPEACSNLSPHLHFGFLSPQRLAFEAKKLLPKYRQLF